MKFCFLLEVVGPLYVRWGEKLTHLYPTLILLKPNFLNQLELISISLVVNKDHPSFISGYTFSEWWGYNDFITILPCPRLFHLEYILHFASTGVSWNTKASLLICFNDLILPMGRISEFLWWHGPTLTSHHHVPPHSPFQILSCWHTHMPSHSMPLPVSSAFIRWFPGRNSLLYVLRYCLKVQLKCQLFTWPFVLALFRVNSCSLALQ